MPLFKGKSKKVVGANVGELVKAGHDKNQAVAIAMQKAGKAKKKRATPSPSWGRRHVEGQRRRAGRDNEVVNKIRAEAKTNGVSLAHGGKGGLDPNLALRVFRKGKWKCSVPNCKTPKENLDLDHIGGHVQELKQDPDADAWLKKEAAKGKQDNEDGIHTLCLRHHDMVHTRERAIEDDKKPPAMSK